MSGRGGCRGAASRLPGGRLRPPCYDGGVSHEDPDLEVPEAVLLKDELKALGGRGSPPAGATEVPLLERFDELKGRLTAKSTGAVVAGLMA